MDIFWLSKDMALAFHLRQLAEHGGGAGVRDIGLLESALQRPQNKFEYEQSDIATLAAAYAYGIARNHPFVDGNKRTALVAFFTFLFLNGYKVATTQTENLTTFLKLAEGSLTEDELASWFRSHMQLKDHRTGGA
jgi:death on curing protein